MFGMFEQYLTRGLKFKFVLCLFRIGEQIVKVDKTFSLPIYPSLPLYSLQSAVWKMDPDPGSSEA